MLGLMLLSAHQYQPLWSMRPVADPSSYVISINHSGKGAKSWGGAWRGTTELLLSAACS